MLGGVGNGIGQLPAVTQGANLLVGLQETLVALVVARLILRAVQFLTAHVAVTEGDARVQLGAVEESVGAVTDTARVVAALIVVGKGAPLRRGIDGALLENQAAVAADEITAGVVFAEVGRILLAVAADHAHAQILLPLFLLGWGELIGLLTGREALSHDGERLAWKGGPRVAGDKAGVGALADALGALRELEFFRKRADEEWRVRGGGWEGGKKREKREKEISTE